MEQNVVQHHDFTPFLEAFGEYAKSCIDKSSPTRFTAIEFQKRIDDFATKMQQHLTEEVATLVALSKYDTDAIRKAYSEFEEGLKKADKVNVSCI